CWATALGYDCCTQPNSKVFYTDKDGEWGFENDKWCGIIVEKADEDVPVCWAKALGYDCCTTSTIGVAYTDKDGEWGVENNVWCGI
ncbi:Non-catalytic module family DOC2, partial [Piromyces sp. E2]